MRSHRSSNHKSNPQYSSTSATIEEVMKTDQIIQLLQDSEKHEFPQKP